MLSVLKTAARALSSRPEQCSLHEAEDGPEVLYVDFELRDVLTPLPEIAWSRVTDLCTRTVAPAYWTLHNTLRDDVDHLAHLMAGLEYASSSSVDDDERKVALAFRKAERQVVRGLSPERPPRKRRRSSAVDDHSPLIIRGSDPSVPTIVITPCPSQPREFTSLVPFQDALFGNRLTVPTHPALNDVYPPLVATSCPLVEHWRYEDGHWWAVLPNPEEQVTRGMFSRPLPSRRRKAHVGPRPSHDALRIASAL